MNDTIDPDIKVLLFYAVFSDPLEFTPSKIVKTRNSDIASSFEKSRLLNCRKKGRSLYLSANDATWRWVEEHFADELPHRNVTSFFLLKLRSGLANFLSLRNIRLSEILAPAPVATEPIAQSPADQVRQAYLCLSGGEFEARVRLRDLRPALPNLSRSQQDEILLAMQNDGWLALYANDDPQDRTSGDEAAAMIIGDRHRDLVHLHRDRRR